MRIALRHSKRGRKKCKIICRRNGHRRNRWTPKKSKQLWRLHNWRCWRRQDKLSTKRREERRETYFCFRLSFRGWVTWTKKESGVQKALIKNSPAGRQFKVTVKPGEKSGRRKSVQPWSHIVFARLSKWILRSHALYFSARGRDNQTGLGDPTTVAQNTKV